MTVSQVTSQDVKDYCGIYDEDSDNLLPICMNASLAFIKSYTGLTAEQIEEHEDISIAYMVLANEMFTNRDYTVNKDKLNPCVHLILSMHSINYL